MRGNYYTLFVDESGSFREDEGGWVVAGLLLPLGWAAATQVLDRCFAQLPSACGLPNRAAFHLTELRETRDHARATACACELFDALEKSGHDFHLLATEHHRGQRLKYPEKTYRQMLLDLLALADSLMPEGLGVDHIDLIVAIRTDDVGVRTTTDSEIRAEILEAIPAAAEFGLASQRLVEAQLRERIQVHLEHAEQHWGTVAADFVANLVRNAHHPESAAALEIVEARGRLRRFYSFGGHDVRRAQVAERDGDLITALCRWASVTVSTEPLMTHRSEAIGRLVRRIIASAGSAGPAFATETIIERLRQTTQKPGCGFRAVERALATELPLAYQATLFRFRNYMLLQAVQAGESDEADRLVALQEPLVSRTLLSPEDFHKVLDYQCYRVEAAVLRLDFAGARAIADRHWATLQHYRALWSLLTDTDEHTSGVHHFDCSRLAVRGACTRIRAELLAADEPSAALPSIEGWIRDAERSASRDEDGRRLRNYHIAALLRGGDVERALAMAATLPENHDAFDLTWAARAAADWVLGNTNERSTLVDHILSVLRASPFADPNRITRHPHELVVREHGILELCYTGEVHSGRRHLELSRDWLRRQPCKSALQHLMLFVAELHVEFARASRGSLPSTGSNPWGPALASWVAHIMQDEPGQVLVGSRDGLKASLRRVRRYGP